jgi:hypothetical protein
MLRMAGVTCMISNAGIIVPSFAGSSCWDGLPPKHVPIFKLETT